MTPKKNRTFYLILAAISSLLAIYILVLLITEFNDIISLRAFFLMAGFLTALGLLFGGIFFAYSAATEFKRKPDIRYK